jgi:hypothetical protein
MSEPDNSRSAGERAEQPEILVDRREVTGEAVKRFAKYTAPAMLVALMASSGKAIAQSLAPSHPIGGTGGH